jgi:dihydrofolate reductase
MTVKLYIATTLDGYIADENDSLQWLFDVEGEGDNGYGAFISGIDVVVMGNSTYRWLLRESPDKWPYADKKTYVFSRTAHENTENVTFVSELSEIAELTDPSVNLWNVGGGEIIKLFLENDLVDELQVTVAPVLLGKGKPLFPAGNYAEKLKLVGSTTYGQFVELHYLMKK